MTKARTAALAAGILILTLLLWPGVAQARVIERSSVSSTGAQGNDWSDYAAPSGDGRYVAFQSAADNLVVDDTNLVEDVFVRDRQTGTTVRVSVASDGTQGNEASYYPAISADGALVVFTSDADNLVPGDTNGRSDVFVHNLQTGATIRASVSSAGAEGDDESSYPSISADGSVVAFRSLATTLVDGDTNGYQDTFVYTMATQVTELVSVDSQEAQGNADGTLWPAGLSADGRYVCFGSWADNLITGDTNDLCDIFVRDRTDGTTARVSVASDGAEADDWSDYATISADGRYVTFDSLADNLVAGDGNWDWDIFVHDRTTGATTRASVSTAGTEGDLMSWCPSISGDGRYVAFESFATNLVGDDSNGDWDIFVHDRTTGATTRVSVSAAGAESNGWSGTTLLSADGRYLTFSSIATNLVTPDANTDFCDVLTVVNPATLIYSSIRGSDRYDTAIRISKAMFPGALPPGSGLVVAPGETFPEALCGAPLAAAYGGPVLLTYRTALANNVKTELQRLAPAKVFCIGLSAAAISQVAAALPGAEVTPINGAGTTANVVYDMSRRVALALEAKVGDMSGATAIVTVGTNFPDAIGVSPLACSQLWPVVLTDKADGSVLHASAAATFTDLGLTKALKVGTYVTLPGGVAGLANLSGADRYVTNVNVATWAKANAGLAFTHTAMATGDKFPDALASGPYLAGGGGVLLLSPLVGPVPSSIRALLTANATAVYDFSFIACIEPVIGQVKALLP